MYATGAADMPQIAAPGFVTFGRWLDGRVLIGLYDERLWRLSLDGPPVALTDTGATFALDPARARCAWIDRTG